MRFLSVVFVLILSSFQVFAQTTELQARRVTALDSFRVNGNWIKRIIRDSSLDGDARDLASVEAIRQHVANRFSQLQISWDLIPNKPIFFRSTWDSVFGKPANFTTTYALSNDIRDSLTERYTKAQADARFLQSAPITSVFGRTGAVVAQSGDYTTAQVTESGNLYYTDARSRSAISLTTTGTGGTASYNSSTGVFNIPVYQTQLGYTAENVANKGVANGYADLDASGKVPASRIDFGQTGQTFVVASQAEMLAVSGANIGALAVRTDQNRNYRLIAQPASNLSHWILLLSPDAPVQSVNGQTGNVNLLTTNISEGSNLYFTNARAISALTGQNISIFNNNSGYITGINSSMVTTALGYTPVQPNGTGATGTWGINISGNAATATTATNWSGSSALGSYAYRSSGLAELSGATFTGAVSATRATIGTAGNVDISNQYIAVNRNGSTGGIYTNTVNAFQIQTTSSNPFELYGYNTSGTNIGSIIMNSSGNVGIGTTSPSSLLHVNGTATFTGEVSSTFNTNGFSLSLSKSAGFGSLILLKNTSTSSNDLIRVLDASNNIISQIQPATNGISFASGNVGIGTTSPSYRTHIVGGNGDQFAIDNTGQTFTQQFWRINGSNIGTIWVSSTEMSMYTYGSQAIVLHTNAVERFRISSTGAITASSSITATQFNGSGAGLTSVPWGSITGAPSFLTTAVTNATGTANQITVSASTGAVTFSLPSAVTISGNMTAAAFFESSDIRQKKVHETLVSKDGIDAIQYTFLPDGKSKWGYSAQQVKNIVPFAVTEGSDGFMKVDYTTVHTYKIMQLEERVKMLEEKIQLLINKN